MDEALALLAKIVNRASRTQQTKDGIEFVALPVELLKQARDFLEAFRERGTNEIRQATNRVF